MIDPFVVENKRTRSTEHDPEKLALGLDPMGGHRFSEKIMLRAFGNVCRGSLDQDLPVRRS
jgi:hypothetical protein